MATSNVYKLDYESFPTTQGGLFSPVKMYIYNTDELDLYHTIIDVTGSAVPNSIMFDGEKNIFDWIKKTSLELSIVREDESWFTDLIDGYDDQWAICVVQDGDMRHKELGVWTGTGGEFSGTLLFYGKLTFQTYSEAYAYKAEIRLTFHDRIGVMEDELFEQNGNTVTLLDIMANCLRPCVCSNNLVAEFPYTSVEYPDVTGLEYLALPGSKYAGEKKIDVVESICKSFGLRVDTDFTFKRNEGEYQSPEICGAIWLRHIASQKNDIINNRQYHYVRSVVGSNIYDSYDFVKTDALYKNGISSSVYKAIIPFRPNIPEYMPGEPPAEENRRKFKLIQVTHNDPVGGFLDPRNNVAYIYLTTDESKLVPGQPYIRANSTDLKLSQIKNYWDVAFPDNGIDFIVDGNNLIVKQRLKAPPLSMSIWDQALVLDNWKQILYSYSEDNKVAAIKDIDQTNITLINNSASFELDIKAKSVEVDWKPKNIGNIFQGGNPEEFDFVNREQDGYTYSMHRYTTVITDNDTPINLKRYLSGVAVPETLRLGARKANYGGDLCIQLTVRSEVLFGNPNVQRYVQGPLPAIAIENQYLGASFSVVAKNAREFEADGQPRSASVYVSWFAVTEAGAILYYKNKDEGWLPFDQFTIQFWNSGNVFRNQVNRAWNTLSVDTADMVRHPYTEIGVNTPYKLYFAVSGDYTEVNIPEVMFIKDCKFSVTGMDFPTEIKQTTNIAPKNRKSIKVDIDVNTFPGGSNDTLFYTDCLVNWPSGTACRLLTYEGLNQTLQAHLGDQYALEYQFDRWMFSVELLGQIKLRDILRLQPEGRLFVVAEGGFDIKARQFKGTLAEFVTTEAKDALLSEDGTYILQEDGSKILI